MRRFNAPAVAIDVVTRRAGAFSRVGHDLRLRVGDVVVEVGDGAIDVRVAAASLVPVCAIVDGRDAAGKLSDADLRRIASNLQGEVLQSRLHPTMTLHLTIPAPDATRAEAWLSLRGVTRPVTLFWHREGERLCGHAVVAQGRWGIEPYTTMFGALRVADEVEVEFSLPAGALVSP